MKAIQKIDENSHHPSTKWHKFYPLGKVMNDQKDI